LRRLNEGGVVIGEVVGVCYDVLVGVVCHGEVGVGYDVVVGVTYHVVLGVVQKPLVEELD
jgi:hypothetical protein